MGKKGGTSAVTQTKSGQAGQKKVKKTREPYFDSTAKNYRIGSDLRPKRDLTRYVKFPRYVRLQRQRRILLQRLKVPPTIHQFNMALSADQAAPIFNLLAKYKPETRSEKKGRLGAEAKKQADGNMGDDSKKPCLLKFGLSHVSDLVESKLASLVIIAHDVDPLELVLWLPALCRKKDVPYCIVKGKAKLGQLCHKKSASAVCITGIKKEDQGELKRIQESCLTNFNNNESSRKQWGGGERGVKSRHILEARERSEAAAEKKRAFAKMK